MWTSVKMTQPIKGSLAKTHLNSSSLKWRLSRKESLTQEAWRRKLGKICNRIALFAKTKWLSNMILGIIWNACTIIQFAIFVFKNLSSLGLMTERFRISDVLAHRLLSTLVLISFHLHKLFKSWNCLRLRDKMRKI